MQERDNIMECCCSSSSRLRASSGKPGGRSPRGPPPWTSPAARSSARGARGGARDPPSGRPAKSMKRSSQSVAGGRAHYAGAQAHHEVLLFFELPPESVQWETMRTFSPWNPPLLDFASCEVISLRGPRRSPRPPQRATCEEHEALLAVRGWRPSTLCRSASTS